MVTYFLVFILFYFKYVTTERTDSRQTISGRYTRDVVDYEIILPRKVKPNGAFDTFWLPHHYDNYLRKKRSLGEEDKVHYNLEFNGRRHHLELTPNVGLLAPGAVVEAWRVPGNISSAKIKQPSSHLCHYHGHIRGMPDSRVALSACSGLAGHIATDNGSFFIEPILNEEAQRYGEHLHIVYKRSLAHHSRGHNCGTKSGDPWDYWARDIFKYKLQSISKGLGLQPFSKRSTEEVVPRFIEVGMFLDGHFCEYHKTRKEEYILTMMNANISCSDMNYDPGSALMRTVISRYRFGPMGSEQETTVNTFYRDFSIGNLLELVITKMVFLDVDKPEIHFETLSDANEGLPLFCEWQKPYNHPDPNHPNHYDIAVLVTRHDICSDNDCGLLGLAFMGAVCDTSNLNCCINEDSGLVLSVVIAHEIGHMVGCQHDEPETSGCSGFVNATTDDAPRTVMNPYVVPYTTEWSSCSREYISLLLGSRGGTCLLNEPKDQPYKYNEILPGAVYDITAQCQLRYGPTFVQCKRGSEVCTALWCKESPTAKRCSSFGPPADGTECAPNKWCYKGECIEVGVMPETVDGGWGDWGPWSKCSRTCGGGVEIRERICNNPQPKHLGRYCQGTRKEYTICNTQPCGHIAKYRQEQCEEFNKKEVDGKLHTWNAHLPAFNDPDFCKLYCLNEEDSLHLLRPRVADGTRCHPGTKNTCIQGSCVSVGCDWKIESGAVEDICGVCNGDGTHCVAQNISYTKVESEGSVKSACSIPKGATNVIVREAAPSKNYLLYISPERQFYVENTRGNPPGEYLFGEDVAVLSYPEMDQEEMYMKGPIKKDLRVFYAFAVSENVGLTCTFVTEIKVPKEEPSYRWEFLKWEPCTALCGTGSEISKPDCVEKHGGRVSESFCDKTKKPEPQTRTCNEQKCGTHWKVWKWGECSGCLNKKGERHRQVECIMESPTLGADEDIIVDPSQCCGTPPKKTESCTSSKPCDEKEKKKKRRTSDDIFESEFLKYNLNTSDLKDYEYRLFKRAELHTTVNPASSSKKTLFVDILPVENISLKVAEINKCEGQAMQLSEETYEDEGANIANEILTNVKTLKGKQAMEKYMQVAHLTTRVPHTKKSAGNTCN